MDKDQLAQLLQASQIPDTEKVKAVTAELQKNYYSQPQSLLLLIEIAVSHNDAGIRQLASVQAQRITAKHWLKVNDDQRNVARKHLIESAVNDPTTNGRHSKCRLLARAISIDLDNKDAAGQACVEQLLSLVSQESTAAREVGSFTLYAILDEDPTNFTEQVPQLLNILKPSARC
ncbi:Importin subunit beta-4 like protein [Verticillium longisporum]|uniref:Importin subunit beta-4 like protein n=1 Tax=Verticillium longisporum TaxID=100787 RepID=A0A8I3AKW1_VERLO|nr:Importin subunit beta-4 like protein [Verticillium longisporum]